jgi:hypothetical protein
VLFWAGVENGDFEARNLGYNQSPEHWTWNHHSAAGGYWGCENRSGDSRSGSQSYWLLMTDNGTNKAGDWIQVEQKVQIGKLSVSRNNQDADLLYAVYPNPAMRDAMITYQLPFQSNTTMKIFDANGRLVKTLIDGQQEPGFYEIDWDGTDQNSRSVSSGVYFCNVIANPLEEGETYTKTKKVVFLR